MTSRYGKSLDGPPTKFIICGTPITLIWHMEVLHSCLCSSVKLHIRPVSSAQRSKH